MAATSSTNAVFFFHPLQSPLKAVDLARPLSEIEVREARDEVVATSIAGQRQRIVYSTKTVVRVVAELITDQAVVRNLEILCNHLRRGGGVAVAEVGNRTLGAFVKRTPDRGDTSLILHTQKYSNFGGSFTAASGDTILLRGPSPRGLREDLTATTGSTTSTINLSTAVTHEWEDEGWAFVHNRGFWPGLVLQSGATNADLLRSTRRIHYTLDLPLEEAPLFLDRQAEDPEDLFPGDIVQGGTITFDDYMSEGGDVLTSANNRPLSDRMSGSTSAPTGRWWR